MNIDEMSAKLAFLKNLRDETAQGKYEMRNGTRGEIIAGLDDLITEGESILKEMVEDASQTN